jgi:hypothetical protein
MASGHMNRVKRPDTWLHRPMLRNVKKVLANPEPSTHDPKRAFGAALAAALCNADPQIANVRSTGCVASQQTRPKKAGQ